MRYYAQMMLFRHIESVLTHKSYDSQTYQEGCWYRHSGIMRSLLEHCSSQNYTISVLWQLYCNKVNPFAQSLILPEVLMENDFHKLWINIDWSKFIQYDLYSWHNSMPKVPIYLILDKLFSLPLHFIYSIPAHSIWSNWFLHQIFKIIFTRWFFIKKHQCKDGSWKLA